MHSATILSGFLVVLLAAFFGPAPADCTVSLRPRSTTTTPIPSRKERLPYTPVRDSTRQERLPYTPPKSTTLRPGLRPRTIATQRIPFPTKTTAKPCNCNCNVTDYRPLCAGDGTDQDTFPNQCQLDCYNCTLNKRYRVISQGECSR